MRKLIGTAILAAAALCAQSLATQAQTAKPDIQKIIQGAKAEGKLVVWLTTPALPRTQAAVFDAFNKRFGLSIKYEWLPMHPMNSMSRLATESKAGHVPADVIGAFSYSDILGMKEKGLLKAYPWTEAFSKELPSIGEPADRMIAALRGYGLAYFDQVFLLAWNKNQIKEAELPNKLTDLADPKWKGRFVTNAIFGLPLDTLSVALGGDGSLALAKRLLANRPFLKRGSPAVTQSLVSGEAPVGIGTYLEGDRSQKLKRPIDFRLFADYVPVMPLHIIVPDGAPHPNAARLFAAWLVTDGVAIVNKMEAGGRITDKNSALAKFVDARPASSEVVMPKDIAQVREIRSMRRELNQMFTGR